MPCTVFQRRPTWVGYLLTGMVLSAALASQTACDEPGGKVDPYPAPDFTLTDVNPDSATYLQSRQLAAAQGRVIVLYFAAFS